VSEKEFLQSSICEQETFWIDFKEFDDTEPPAHTDRISERNRKSRVASDASTTLPKTRKKAKADKGNSTRSNTIFNERCNQLIRFKEEFGHCNAPHRYAENPSLGQWCSDVRSTYKNIQKETKTKYNLSQGRIERLEEIGLQWN